ncbi:hypothetical protein C7974DRAFT_451488 [Boeremia exigua]|uniref:uncharacterized protein n=1 Tax=Boeremia exigua TaxID=749465 RepID=UPI001E8CA07E|nr:uncharacterized protein C7974DRAFT_451488 [Boeremia exigua]KAH6638201.1 hypothetical protein C7974DRAFT_451488 [Boeremia exigua]
MDLKDTKQNHRTQGIMAAMLRRSGRSSSPRVKPYDYGACPSEPTAQDKYFYTADGSRDPITNQADEESTVYVYPPKNIKALRFDAAKWQNTPRPRNYHGIWPPTCASQLMNTRMLLHDDSESREAKQFRKTNGEQAFHECLGKFCWQQTDLPDGIFCVEENCNHTVKEWLTGAASWEERFEFQTLPHMGHGLFSKCNWKKGNILGAYLGELIPSRTSNTEYCHEVFIGPEFEKTGASIAYIDAERCGNYVRFCNHSCENNANISEERVGEERVLVLRATKRIAAGEQVTIDYGTDFFRGGQCLFKR